MSGLKYALAMLGAGSATAMASEAAAATYLPPIPLSPYDAPVDISIFDGSPAHFYYGAGTAKVAPGSSGPAAILGTYGTATVGINSPLPGFSLPGSTQVSGEVKLGALAPSDPMDPASALVFSTLAPGVDQYVSLTFQEAGVGYAGSAHVDGAGYLQSIEYEVTAVPEPASWALMIGGFGLAGAALRSRRRQAALSA
jgi:hypothetical protein